MMSIELHMYAREGASITLGDLIKLRHMLGVNSTRPRINWGYRNYYTSDCCESLERLVAAGLVRRVNERCWSATLEGAQLVGLTKARITELQAKGGLKPAKHDNGDG